VLGAARHIVVRRAECRRIFRYLPKDQSFVNGHCSATVHNLRLTLGMPAVTSGFVITMLVRRMAMDPATAGLVIDIGVSEGNDSAYYLAKGFRVIAVEADSRSCARLRQRFASEIASGALQLLPFAAADTFGQPVNFYVHQVHQGISALAKQELPYLINDYTEEQVLTIDWKTLVAQQGVPRYLKIDIEGHEASFLRGMLGSPALPEFISVECHLLEPVELLHALGYRRFRLIDQNAPEGFALPPRQIEGVPVPAPDFRHASGPFGLDVFGDGVWLDYAQMRQAWEDVLPRRANTWFDCHAWQPANE
jgi:FkbM family methyltransferase